MLWTHAHGPYGPRRLDVCHPSPHDAPPPWILESHPPAGPGATTHAWALRLPLVPPLGQRPTILIVSFRRLHLASPRQVDGDGD